jgi:hypothetical protein
MLLILNFYILSKNKYIYFIISQIYYFKKYVILHIHIYTYKYFNIYTKYQK